MKAISALDILFVTRELKLLVGTIVEKIFHPSKKEFTLSLHKSGSGKMLLRILVGQGLFLSKSKFSSDASSTPSPFCMLLRKRLKQSRVIDVVQPGLERIIEIHFSNDLKLIVELFSKGNVVLCDKENKILAILEKQEWKHRSIKKGDKYTFPPAGRNPFLLSDKEFTDSFNSSTKESTVKILAIDFSLGGKYAEEICLAAKVDKNKKKVNTSKLLKELQNLKNKPLKPFLVMDLDGKTIVDFSPVDLEIFKEVKKQPVNSCSEALEKIFETVSEDTISEKGEKERLMNLAEKQKLKIGELKKKGEDYKKIGDLINTKFMEIDNIIKDIKKNNWKIKHPLVKELNKKERKVVLEL